MKLGLDVPGHWWPAVFGKDYVDALRVEVFCIQNEPVHVEEARPDWGKADEMAVSIGIERGVRPYSVLGAIVGFERKYKTEESPRNSPLSNPYMKFDCWHIYLVAPSNKRDLLYS